MALAKPAGFAFQLLILDTFSPHELQPGRRRLREDWRDIGDVGEHASELTYCGEVQNEVAIVQGVAAGNFVGPSKLGKLCAEPGQFSVRHSKSGLRGSALEKNWGEHRGCSP